MIEVIDNGVGIPPSMMNHMFELFHSTKGNRGTGLGLAVAKKIVEEHEGSISVKSKQGEGTTFTIRLPVFSATDVRSLAYARPGPIIGQNISRSFSEWTNMLAYAIFKS